MKETFPDRVTLSAKSLKGKGSERNLTTMAENKQILVSNYLCVVPTCRAIKPGVTLSFLLRKSYLQQPGIKKVHG